MRAADWADIEARVRPDPRAARAGRAGLHRQRRHDPVLGHGHHPAPPQRRHDPDARQPAAAARQHRQARRRPLPGARPLQRAGRPHDGHLREDCRTRSSTGSARAFGFEPPRAHGFDTIAAIEAMHDGRGKVFFAMGGNFAAATPDSAHVHAALRRCALTVHVQHQAQPLAPGARPRGADPAVPGPHRDRPAGRRAAGA